MRRGSIIWLLVGAAALCVVGCDETEGGAQSQGDDPTPVAPSPTDPAATPTPPIDIDAEISRHHDELADAAGDFCATVQSTGHPLDITPQTEEQAVAAAELIVAMIRHMGAVAETDAWVYDRAADRFEADVAKAEHSPEWLQSPDAFESFHDPDFTEATARLRARADAECPRG